MLKGFPNVCIGISRVLQFNYRQWQPVYKDNYIRAALDSILNYGKLIDGNEIIIHGVVIVNHVNNIPANGAIRALVFYSYTFNQISVDDMIVSYQRRLVGVNELAQGFSQSISRYSRIDKPQRIPEPSLQYDLAVRFPLSQ